MDLKAIGTIAVKFRARQWWRSYKDPPSLSSPKGGLRAVSPSTQLSPAWDALSHLGLAADLSSPSKPTQDCIHSWAFLTFTAEWCQHANPSFLLPCSLGWALMQHPQTPLKSNACYLNIAGCRLTWAGLQNSAAEQCSTVEPSLIISNLTLSAASLQHSVYFISASFLNSFPQTQAVKQQWE